MQSLSSFAFHFNCKGTPRCCSWGAMAPRCALRSPTWSSLAGCWEGVSSLLLLQGNTSGLPCVAARLVLGPTAGSQSITPPCTGCMAQGYRCSTGTSIATCCCRQGRVTHHPSPIISGLCDNSHLVRSRRNCTPLPSVKWQLRSLQGQLALKSNGCSTCWNTERCGGVGVPVCPPCCHCCLPPYSCTASGLGAVGKVRRGGEEYDGM